MGRAINMEKDLGLLREDIDQLKSAFEGLAATVETLQGTAPANKHIDLKAVNEGLDELSDKEVEETEVEEAEA